MRRIKKAQSGYKSPFGKKTADSTAYFNAKAKDLMNAGENLRIKSGNPSVNAEGVRYVREGVRDALEDRDRQRLKGLPGFDKNGRPVSYDRYKKGNFKTGGRIKKAQAGLKASNKRVGPVDPKGAWTTVQKKTLAGKRTPVSLTRDKQLGATSMTAKRGIKVKAKGGKWIQSAIKKPGALRKSLGAKPGKPIPAAKLAKAAKAKGKLGQRARLAMTLKKMRKK
jgi:hypothetical protein